MVRRVGFNLTQTGADAPTIDRVMNSDEILQQVPLFAELTHAERTELGIHLRPVQYGRGK